jgi:hypothetical protein
VLIGFLSTPLLAQQSPPKQEDALKTLNRMVGNWEGESWIESAPGQRRTNRSLKTILSKVGGAVLLIEGYHKGKSADQGETAKDVVTHESINILLCDAKANRYGLVAYTARQGYGDFRAKVVDRGWEWEIETPSGRVRFTIAHAANDERSEKDEASQDGKAWHQFLGMTAPQRQIRSLRVHRELQRRTRSRAVVRA